METDQLWLTFYQKLGYLCYAIAAADKKLTPAEAEQLKRLVTAEWLEVEDSLDEFGGDAAFQTEIVFDWLSEQYVSSENAFKVFSDFFTAHPQFFNNSLKKGIWNTANFIADAFHGKNKEEKELLARLKKLLGT